MNVHAARRVARNHSARPENYAGVIIDEIVPRMKKRSAGMPSTGFIQYLAKKQQDGEINRAQLRKVLDAVMRRPRLGQPKLAGG